MAHSVVHCKMHVITFHPHPSTFGTLTLQTVIHDYSYKLTTHYCTLTINDTELI